jgi:hypothetical protein
MVYEHSSIQWMIWSDVSTTNLTRASVAGLRSTSKEEEDKRGSPFLICAVWKEHEWQSGVLENQESEDCHFLNSKLH